MKKNLLIVSLIFVIIVCSVFVVGCEVADKINAPEIINGATAKINQFKSASVEITVKAETETVYVEKTSYTVTASGVSYDTKVQKPSEDVWQADDLSETESNDTVAKSDVLTVLNYSMTVSLDQLKSLESKTLDNGYTFSFSLSQAESILDLPKGESADANVEMTVIDGLLVSFSIRYDYRGFTVDADYKITY